MWPRQHVIERCLRRIEPHYVGPREEPRCTPPLREPQTAPPRASNSSERLTADLDINPLEGGRANQRNPTETGRVAQRGARAVNAPPEGLDARQALVGRPIRPVRAVPAVFDLLIFCDAKRPGRLSERT